MKIGILVHGRHLQAVGWPKLAWGEPEKGNLGSLPLMVYTALTEGLENIAVVVFGTGASEKDGLKEAEYTKKYLVDHMNDLSQFACIKEHEGFQSHLALARLSKLCDGIVTETVSTNTVQEIANTAKIFQAHGCTKVIQITCGSHEPRCARLRSEVKKQGLIPRGQIWYSIGDDMTFADSSISDVVIVEPPHRGDDPLLGAVHLPHRLVPRMFKIDLGLRQHFLSEFDELLTEYNV
ncbi:MAG: hypothetical protein A2408_02550 [Candidatus Yonathbacteria bacterium RIFOXYC1_FULL_52_10]|uniref:Uncharacterized protein n=1 Tax=Candidatus Yonathbacteria bacterium RIFOXYD1_FULL_52_36 TaxID=1802730 RepID=A0A1G2SKW4_9BACT|nr:MAG: hypothetical protein A2408_02550 [Candidatus Yonathbacteria bacterium RIFOXYC1_FULL_52_10]OHA85664.1 MAG: hypothetical protein A2591_02420 [Candidatus Yonathbacteria bacterium RIFOXYD1_FULL_52_36]